MYDNRSNDGARAPSHYSSSPSSSTSSSISSKGRRRSMVAAVTTTTTAASIVIVIVAILWQKEQYGSSSIFQFNSLNAVISSSWGSASALLSISSSSSSSSSSRQDRNDDECTTFNIKDSFLRSSSSSKTSVGSEGPEEQQEDHDRLVRQQQQQQQQQHLRPPRYDCTKDDDDHLSNFLLEQHQQQQQQNETRGMHLVCFHIHNKSISFFRGMSYSNHKTVSFVVDDGDVPIIEDEDGEVGGDIDVTPTTATRTTTSWEELAIWSTMKKVLYNGLEIGTKGAPRIVPFGPERSRRDDDWKRQFRPQPWTIFSLDGQQLLIKENSSPCTSTKSLWEEGMVLLIEGGQFVWPGVKVGFKRDINVLTTAAAAAVGGSSTDAGTMHRNVTLETLSLQPLIFSVDENFLNDEECTYVRGKAQPKLKYSETAIQNKDVGETFGWSRTSSSTVIRDIDPQLQILRRRTAQLVRADATHLEPTSVSRYHLGEYYGPHRDYYEPTLYGNDPATLRHLHNGYRNRMISIFWYLNDVPQNEDDHRGHYDKSSMNGVTSFPLSSNISLKDACTTGLQVSPRKGKVVFMYSLHADGSVDSSTLNADCPVQRGVKYQGNIWVWNKPVLAAQYA